VRVALLVVLLSFLGAPFQCASDPDPARRMEDTPSEALWNLSERFREQGQDEARRETLQEIVRSYPNSREAERARLQLDETHARTAEPAPANGATPPEDGDRAAPRGGESAAP